MSKLKPISTTQIGQNGVTAGNYSNVDGFDVAKDPAVIKAIDASLKADTATSEALKTLTTLRSTRNQLVTDLGNATTLRDRAQALSNWFNSVKSRSEDAPGIGTGNYYYNQNFDGNTFVVMGVPYYGPQYKRDENWGYASAGVSRWNTEMNSIYAKIATLDGPVTSPASIAYADKIHKEAVVNSDKAYLTIEAAKKTALINYQEAAKTAQETSIPLAEKIKLDILAATSKANLDLVASQALALMKNKKTLIYAGVAVAITAVLVGGIVVLKHK